MLEKEEAGRIHSPRLRVVGETLFGWEGVGTLKAYVLLLSFCERFCGYWGLDQLGVWVFWLSDGQRLEIIK